MNSPGVSDLSWPVKTKHCRLGANIPWDKQPPSLWSNLTWESQESRTLRTLGTSEAVGKTVGSWGRRLYLEVYAAKSQKGNQNMQAFPSWQPVLESSNLRLTSHLCRCTVRNLGRERVKARVCQQGLAECADDSQAFCLWSISHTPTPAPRIWKQGKWEKQGCFILVEGIKSENTQESCKKPYIHWSPRFTSCLYLPHVLFPLSRFVYVHSIYKRTIWGQVGDTTFVPKYN